ncbi:MAG TPA: 16S rRNA (guanine(527)-N(7))-methyltransferase RsmG [Caulobacteraceae bacterium]|jgi:16S rRNA (guanine527-N7)-methyltransferase
MSANPARARPEPAPKNASLDASYDAAAFARDSGADVQALADIETFRAQLEETNRTLNLVADSTMPLFWSRHALDSAQLLTLAPDARTWADLGAGAGFPGVILAILLKRTPGARVHLIDSLTKRCRFLQDIVTRLDLPAEVHDARAEDVKLAVDVVTARACAPMTKLLGFAQPYFRAGAQGWFLKGATVEDELDEARKTWRFDADLIPSLSDPRGRVVHVRSLNRVR